MDYLAGLASHVPADQAIVEIGTHQAANLCSMAAAAKSGLGATCYGIDPYGSGDIYRGRPHMLKRYTNADHKIAVNNLHRHHLTYDAKILVQTSVDAASSWRAGPKIGLLVIDGEHTEQAVLTDYHSWQPHLAPGAIIAFDDYEPSRVGVGVIKAVDRLVAAGNIEPGRVIGTRLHISHNR